MSPLITTSSILLICLRMRIDCPRRTIKRTHRIMKNSTDSTFFSRITFLLLNTTTTTRIAVIRYCTLSLNAFADLTQDEFKATRLGLTSNCRDLRRESIAGDDDDDDDVCGDVADSVDWRKNGAITPVKDQVPAGHFKPLEPWKVLIRLLRDLQELVDCDKAYNSGCEGGLMDYAYEFVIKKKNNGIDTEDDYPYQTRGKTCNKDKHWLAIKRSVSPGLL